MAADIVLQAQSSGRSFRWNCRDGWKRQRKEGIISVKRGGFTAFIRDWKAVEGNFGTQTRMEIEIYENEYVLWVRGDITGMLDAKTGHSSGVWRFDSVPDPVRADFVRLEMSYLGSEEGIVLDPGILPALFPEPSE